MYIRGNALILASLCLLLLFFRQMCPNQQTGKIKRFCCELRRKAKRWPWTQGHCVQLPKAPCATAPVHHVQEGALPLLTLELCVLIMQNPRGTVPCFAQG